MERRGSLRSGEMSQGSCKAGRGWDAQTAGDRHTGSADRQVSQVETGAAGERCTAGGWDAFQRNAGGERTVRDALNDCRWTDTGQTLDRHRQQLGRKASSEAAATTKGFRGLALRKERRYAQTNGRHAGNADDARA